MPIRFVCPFGHPLVVPDERAGKRGRCPVCRQRLIIPTPDDNSPALERLPWKRAWPDEPIAVDGGVNSQAIDSFHDSSLATPEPSNSSNDVALMQPGVGLFARFESEQFQFAHDGRRAWRARLLAVALLALAIFSAAPAIAYLDGASTVAWCWCVLVGSALVGTVALAVLWLPDWSTLWIAAWLIGLSTAGYFVALSAAIVAPADRPLPLGLEVVRTSAAGWSGLLVLLSAALGYGCARLSGSWRGDYDAALLDWRQRHVDTPLRRQPATSDLPANDRAPATSDQAATQPLGPRP